jgi:hypothetical protein
MLLEEHVTSHGRGNSSADAFDGFAAFWPKPMPSFVPRNENPTAMKHDDLRSALEVALALSKDAIEVTRIADSWEREYGAYPLLLSAGPATHAVAFLLTKDKEDPKGRIVCYYANTGLGAQKCGDGTIQTTCKWIGGSVIPFIELGRRTLMDAMSFSIYVEFLKARVPGFDPICVQWTPVVNDRMLTLAQYASQDGNIRSFRQRGGTCTYNCILWLIGGVMLEPRDAVEAEKEMKRRGIRELAAQRPTYEERGVRLVMEAAAHAYAGVSWCADEAAKLRTAVEASFGDVMGVPEYTYEARIWGYTGMPEIVFALDPDSFPDAEIAGRWCVDAHTWVRRASRRAPDASEPVFLLFLYKARKVLCVDPVCRASTDALVAIARFLARCRG